MGRPRQIVDMIDRGPFGRMVPLVRAPDDPLRSGARWFCKCRGCCNFKVVYGANLRTGKVKSCGCANNIRDWQRKPKREKAKAPPRPKKKTREELRIEARARVQGEPVNKGARAVCDAEAARFIAWRDAGEIVCCSDAVACHARGRCRAGEKERAA